MDKKADEETVLKMEKLVKEEKKDEKVEEKIHPGIHKEVAKEEHKKEAQVISKLASILSSYKTAGSEGALGDGSAVAPGGMDVGQAAPQEAGAPTAGTPEQIEKLKKILLMMQLKKQQEEAAMAQAQQGNMQVPPEMTAQTSPGAVQGI
jgi:hypothetical protein